VTELPLSHKLTRLVHVLGQAGLKLRTVKMSLAEYDKLRAESRFCADGRFRGVPIRLVKGDVWSH
jgi:hypothetical protein